MKELKKQNLLMSPGTELCGNPLPGPQEGHGTEEPDTFLPESCQPLCANKLGRRAAGTHTSAVCHSLSQMHCSWLSSQSLANAMFSALG